MSYPMQQNNENALPMSAGLAKRLAEAADGFRDGETYYMLSRVEFPYGVICIKTDGQKDALTIAEEKKALLNVDPAKPAYHIFGPFKTDDGIYNLADHDEVEIIFKKSVGEGLEKSIVKTITIPRNVDAVVFNLSSFDKFFLPYYTRLYDLKQAGIFREHVINSLAAGLPPYHGGCTYLCDYEQ